MVGGLTVSGGPESPNSEEKCVLCSKINCEQDGNSNHTYIRNRWVPVIRKAGLHADV